MSHRNRTLIALAFVFFSVQTMVYAAFGPCTTDAATSQTSTIGCIPVPPVILYGYQCFGTLTIFSEQKSCKSTDESSCTNVAIDFAVYYGHTTSSGWTQAGCNAGCSADLTKRSTYPGGSNC